MSYITETMQRHPGLYLKLKKMKSLAMTADFADHAIAPACKVPFDCVTNLSNYGHFFVHVGYLM